MPFFIKRSYETNGFMLESPEHVFALSRMLLFGFTEATGSVCERCDTFGDLLLETRLQTEPDIASAVPSVTLWYKVRCQQLYENMFLDGGSPNLNWNASKLCNTVLTRLLLEVHLKTSRSFWRSLLLMAEVLLWMKEEQPTCVLVFTLDRRHCSLVAGTRSETQQIRHDGFFGNWHTIIRRLRIQELEIGN